LTEVPRYGGSAEYTMDTNNGKIVTYWFVTTFQVIQKKSQHGWVTWALCEHLAYIYQKLFHDIYFAETAPSKLVLFIVNLGLAMSKFEYN
jgi:hypothetical protein